MGAARSSGDGLPPGRSARVDAGEFDGGSIRRGSGAACAECVDGVTDSDNVERACDDGSKCCDVMALAHVSPVIQSRNEDPAKGVAFPRDLRFLPRDPRLAAGEDKSALARCPSLA